MSARPTLRRTGATLAVVLAAGLPALPATAAPAGAPATAATEVTEEELVDLAYPGNAVTEPALVADEEERLSQVRTVASMIRWRGLDVTGPYRLSTGSTYTLVLTKRDAPYGIACAVFLNTSATPWP